MRIARFYQDIELKVETEIVLNARASHHLVVVLRASRNSDCSVFNGDGFEYKAKVLVANKKSVQVLLLKKIKPKVESNLKIHLAQAVSKSDRMDYMVQKATELGANSITPILSERVVVKLDTKRWNKKITHWQQIAISATEQSFRTKVPQINYPLKLAEYVNLENNADKFILDTEAKTRFADNQKPGNNITLLIGPEGGFAKNEIDLAHNNGFKRIGIGPRVLRTETVAPVCLALVQSLWGDL